MEKEEEDNFQDPEFIEDNTDKTPLNQKNQIENPYDKDNKLSNDNENILMGKNNTCLGKIDYYDRKMTDCITNFQVHPIFEFFIYLCARLFNPDFVTAYIIGMFLYSYLKYKDYVFIIRPLIHIAVSLLMTYICKNLFKRPRPEIKTELKRYFNVRDKETNYSMPSGDSLQAGNFAIIIFAYYHSFIGFFIIPLVMFSRIFYFCHYFLDTIVGTIIGLGVSFGILQVVNRLPL